MIPEMVAQEQQQHQLSAVSTEMSSVTEQLVVTVKTNTFQWVIGGLGGRAAACDNTGCLREVGKWSMEALGKRVEIDNMKQVDKTRQFFIPPLTQPEWCA